MLSTAAFARVSVCCAVPSFFSSVVFSSWMMLLTSCEARFQRSSLPWYSSATPSAVKSAIAAFTWPSRAAITCSRRAITDLDVALRVRRGTRVIRTTVIATSHQHTPREPRECTCKESAAAEAGRVEVRRRHLLPRVVTLLLVTRAERRSMPD